MDLKHHPHTLWGLDVVRLPPPPAATEGESPVPRSRYERRRKLLVLLAFILMLSLVSPMVAARQATPPEASPEATPVIEERDRPVLLFASDGRDGETVARRCARGQAAG